ncbi:unnamed protein product [Prorocentrum cordatum]|uniref:Uncharacterized protein n=1 Tax=Prorocentrum cordatum TaxID=2364126 RepID=A0ABN9YCD3_9DINO|nr:unnamed protein product [Polarella glacialis]
MQRDDRYPCAPTLRAKSTSIPMPTRPLTSKLDPTDTRSRGCVPHGASAQGRPASMGSRTGTREHEAVNVDADMDVDIDTLGTEEEEKEEEEGEKEEEEEGEDHLGNGGGRKGGGGSEPLRGTGHAPSVWRGQPHWQARGGCCTRGPATAGRSAGVGTATQGARVPN